MGESDEESALSHLLWSSERVVRAEFLPQHSVTQHIHIHQCMFFFSLSAWQSVSLRRPASAFLSLSIQDLPIIILSSSKSTSSHVISLFFSTIILQQELTKTILTLRTSNSYSHMIHTSSNRYVYVFVFQVSHVSIGSYHFRCDSVAYLSYLPCLVY